MTTTLTTTAFRTTTDVAAELGYSRNTIGRWAQYLGRTCGSGHYTLLMPSDVKIMRAWARIDDRHLRAAARRAIREDHHARWLAVNGAGAQTFDSAEAAARWWIDRGGNGFIRLIDLEAAP